MPKVFKTLTSPVGRKILTGITGLALSLFVLAHLLGNLTLFRGSDAFNNYSYILHEMGFLLYLAEAGLVLFFAVHVYTGISIWWRKKKARPENYEKYASRGGKSKQTFSSRTMIITGLVLLVFTIVHINTFKFGAGWAGEAEYTTVVADQEMRDLSKLVFETFQNEFYVIGYVGVMILLGFHLRHGVWSALQSIGGLNNKLSLLIYTVSGIFAILIALGFLILPIWIYFSGGTP
ncbi:MAG: succinate dehydrogenase cytochrome b subunit [Balneolales bacterium]